MYYVKLIGGLGNQLFQYFFAFYLYKQKKKVLLDCTEFEYYNLHKLSINNYKIKLYNANWSCVKLFYIFKNKYLNHKIKMFSYKAFFLINKIFIKNYIFEKEYKNITKKNEQLNTYFDGYWQNLKYINKNKREILKQIQIKKIRKNHKELLKEISRTPNSIAVQIRRYSSVNREDEFMGNLPYNYFYKSIIFFNKNTKNPFFFIFTNSPKWVENYFKLDKSKYKLIKKFKDYEDLISISSCKHQIISNSTFGWWGAWLNTYKNKIVISPKQWYLKKKTPKNFIPKDWKKF